MAGSLVHLDPGTAAARDICATVYRERNEWRQGDRGRERVTVRDVILPDTETAARFGTVVRIGGVDYTIERELGAASGRRRVTCRRVASMERTRPGYRGGA